MKRIMYFIAVGVVAAGCANPMIKMHKEHLADYCIDKYQQDEVFEACMAERKLALKAHHYSLKGRNRHVAVIDCLDRDMCRILFGEMDYILKGRPKKKEKKYRDKGGWEHK